MISVCEATIFLELAHAHGLVVAADLRLVVRVDRANVVPARVLLRHRLK